MNLAFVLGGLTIIVGLALLIGFIDAGARGAAWRRLADAQGEVQERELALLRPDAAVVTTRPATPQPGVRREDRRLA